MALLIKKYKKQHDYFNVIDTEYKAYILGFIFADGCVNPGKGGKRQDRLRIAVQEPDGYILSKLILDVSGREIVLRDPPSSAAKGQQKMYEISISSNELCANLATHGCNPNKTVMGMSFPELADEMIPHFIRGFFDGDGCVTTKKNTYNGVNTSSVYQRSRIAFTSSDKTFLDSLIKHLPITKTYDSQKLKTLLIHTYWIERVDDVQATYDYLYKDATVFLERKKEKFILRPAIDRAPVEE